MAWTPCCSEAQDFHELWYSSTVVLRFGALRLVGRPWIGSVHLRAHQLPRRPKTLLLAGCCFKSMYLYLYICIYYM